MNPHLEVSVASDPRVRYCGDGDWFAECRVSGCTWYRWAPSGPVASRFADEHEQEKHP